MAARPVGSETSPPVAYWDDLARRSGSRARPPLWRLVADAVNRTLLSRWLPGGRLRRILKTDVFDELVTAGLVPTLSAHTDKLICIDLSSEAGRILQARTSDATIATADVRALPFHDGAFDAVVSHSTLDHFASRAEIDTALREIRRVMRPGGLFIVILDNPLHPIVVIRNALAASGHGLGLIPYAVGATYGPRGLARALSRSGFQLLDLTAIHHLPRLAMVAMDRLAGTPLRDPHPSRVVQLGVAAEALRRWPTRYITGQYVAALARATPCSSSELNGERPGLADIGDRFGTSAPKQAGSFSTARM